MNTIEDSVTALPERRSIDDIKKSYPDEWILLGEPEMDECRRNFISGVVLYHSSNKQELICCDKSLLKKYKYSKAFYNEISKPAEKASVIASVFSTLKPL